MTDTRGLSAIGPRFEVMPSTTSAARKAGLLYLLILMLAPFDHIDIAARFIVHGDAAATARNIVAGALTYRLGILGGLASGIMLLILVSRLHGMFRDVDRKLARLMVTLVAVSVTFRLINLLNQSVPLILSSGADCWSPFTAHQLEVMAYAYLWFRGSGVCIAVVLWGLWLLPFGVLVIRSGLFPRLLGVLLIVACLAYLAVGVTAIALPAHRQVVEQALTPFTIIGEMSMIVWLVVKGAKERLPGALRAPAS